MKRRRAIRTSLARIADALERLAPVREADADPREGAAFVWAQERLATAAGRAQPLALLQGIDAQKATVLANAERLAAGRPAHDMLLWGARGMGKSALVKASVADVAARAPIALVEIARDELSTLPRLFARLEAAAPKAFLVFADDLSFEADERQWKSLRSVLEGGVAARPDNVRLAATSNRRHLVAREMAENDPIHPRDVADDRLALADRFGLSLGFHPCDQDTYLAMVAAYAAAHGLSFDAADAIRWATGRGSRSGRAAWQYTQEVAGRVGVRVG